MKLVHAPHVKILPGRTSDVLDAEWLAELLEHGLLRARFVPPPAIREPPDLTRYRNRLLPAHPSECQRIQKTREDAESTLGSVASDALGVSGVSGRAMVTARVAGERDPQVLAEPATGLVRRTIPAVRPALGGRFSEHPALLIGVSLQPTTHRAAAIARLDDRVDALFAAHTSQAGVPFGQARDRLDTLTGAGTRAAECLIAEIGVDMSRFPTAGHLASGAGVCPGNTITGRTRGSARPPRATCG